MKIPDAVRDFMRGFGDGNDTSAQGGESVALAALTTAREAQDTAIKTASALEHHADETDARIAQLSNVVLRIEIERSIPRHHPKVALEDPEMILLALQEKAFDTSAPTNIAFMDAHCIPVQRANVQAFLTDMAKWGVHVDLIKPVPDKILARIANARAPRKEEKAW